MSKVKGSCCIRSLSIRVVLLVDRNLRGSTKCLTASETSSARRTLPSALCNRQSILAGIGIRATVEAVCRHYGLNKGNLESKIDGLTTAGKVTADGAAILHSLRFMGNDAAHETKMHTVAELGTAFEVIESIIFNALILPRRTAKLLKKPRVNPTTPKP